MIARRGLLAGLGALLAAPAIIRTPGLLMPVRPVLGAAIGVDLGPVKFTTGLKPTLLPWSHPYWAAIKSIAVETWLARTNALDRDGRGNQWAHEEWNVARNEGTDGAQRRLLFGDWPVVDSKFRG